MADWQARLLEASYISPEGNFFLFQYENVSIESDKKTSTFIFPEVNGAFIQDLGRAGRRFPFVVYFSGANHDIQADAFLSALEQKGPGVLTHPRYGVKFVVPTGTITQRDDLVISANQTVFNVTFSETITGLGFPESVEDLLNQIKAAISLFSQIMALQFKTDILIEKVAEKISIEQIFETQRSFVDSTFRTFVKANQEVNSAFQTISASLQANILQLTEIPDIVSEQLTTFIRTPSQIEGQINEKIQLYNNLITNETQKTYIPLVESNQPDNEFRSNTVQAFSSLVGLCESVIDQEFTTRIQAIETEESILNIFEQIQQWQDDSITSLGVIDTGEAYEALITVYSLTVAYLINISFDLPAERIITLGEERNIIELVSELYGDLERIDFFITTNKLTADEIEILPKGKQVVYYV